MTFDDDDLERVLLALPLDEPPAGLHARVMAATVFAPAREPLAKPWEIAVFGTAIAIMVWLIGAVLAVPTLGAAIADALTAGLRLVATPANAAWLAVGGAATLWISLLSVPSGYARRRR